MHPYARSILAASAGELIGSADGLISVDEALQGLFFMLVSLKSDGSRVDSGGV